jgi:hypothetical protein
MRRSVKDKPTTILRTGDIKRDLTKDQLAAFGAAALAYNALEDQIDELLLTVTRMPIWLFPEVSGRINGLEGKVAIIQAAITDAANFDDLKSIKSALSDLSGVVTEFMAFKKTRDTIIHARLVNVAAGIAKGTKQRGKTPYEVILSVEALEGYYGHVLALERVYDAGNKMLGTAITLTELAKDDLYKPQLLQLLESHSIQFQDHLRHRRSLLPLPQFPTEAEIQQAVSRWHEAQQAELRDWMKQFQLPPKRAVIDPATGRIWVMPIDQPKDKDQTE